MKQKKQRRRANPGPGGMAVLSSRSGTILAISAYSLISTSFTYSRIKQWGESDYVETLSEVKFPNPIQFMVRVQAGVFHDQDEASRRD